MGNSYRIQFHEFFEKRKTPADLKLTAKPSCMDPPHARATVGLFPIIEHDVGVCFDNRLSIMNQSSL